MPTSTRSRSSDRTLEGMTTTAVPTILLNSGNPIPQLGFGVFKVDAAETERVVTDAIEAGYRHFDGAKIYGNEEALGRAIAASGIPRDEFFVTTKLWGDDHGAATTGPALEASLERLGMDHVDLYLIHWPHAGQDRYVETWNAMEDLAERGLARSIGVSNFTRENLERVLEASSTVPAVNQIELHPLLQQRELTSFGEALGIRTEAWGPLGQGKVDLAVEAPVLAEIAAAHGATLAQVVLAWHLAEGRIIFPKSTRPERMRENLAAVELTLSADDLAAIDAVDQHRRLATDPVEFAFP